MITNVLIAAALCFVVGLIIAILDIEHRISELFRSDDARPARLKEISLASFIKPSKPSTEIGNLRLEIVFLKETSQVRCLVLRDHHPLLDVQMGPEIVNEIKRRLA